MTAPKLLFAAANGQSSVRAIFDQPMRALGLAAPEDPENPANWTTGGGLPAIVQVLRTSNVEFELVLASPAPVAAGYTVTIAATVENAEGEPMDPGFLTSAPFDVTPADQDLVVSSITWVNDTTLNVTFSEPIATIMFDAYHEVVQFLATERGSREPAVIGFSQSGAVATVTLANPGTRGSRYTVKLNREVFVSDATNTTLLLGEEEQLAWGQGLPPTIASLVITEDQVTVTASEVLGEPAEVEGWVLSHGLYEVDKGSLGPQEALELGATPAILIAPGASQTLGDLTTFSLKKSTRTVPTGQSFSEAATSVVGAGNETVGITTTINKTAGAPLEFLFSGGSDTLARAGRRLRTELDITFTSGPTSFPLVAFTLMNTRTTVIVEKTEDDLAQVRLLRGSQDLGLVSKTFDPTSPFVFEVIDATSDTDGFLAVEVNGEVILGAPSKEVLDDQVINTSVTATTTAVTFGHPDYAAEVFSVEFVQDLLVQSYFGPGFLGIDSNDLFAFPAESSVVVAAAASPPLSSGYQGTGKAAFGVHAEYLPAVNAIQVIVGLNEKAQPLQFTGSVTLLTGQEEVLDQVLVDERYVLVGDNELFIVFLNPVCWSGVLVSVALNIDGVDYSTTVPVTEMGMPQVTANLAPQPSKWYHQRLSNNVSVGNTSSFGPATIIQTP